MSLNIPDSSSILERDRALSEALNPGMEAIRAQYEIGEAVFQKALNGGFSEMVNALNTSGEIFEEEGE